MGMANGEMRGKRSLIAFGAGLLANTIIASSFSLLFVDSQDKFFAALAGVPLIYALQAFIFFRTALTSAIHSIYVLPMRSEEFRDELFKRGMPFGPSFDRPDAQSYFLSVVKSDEVEPEDQLFASEMLGFMKGACRFGYIRFMPSLVAINAAVRRYVAE